MKFEMSNCLFLFLKTCLSVAKPRNNPFRHKLHRRCLALYSCRSFSSQENPSDKKLIRLDPFQEIAIKNKESYLGMVEIYKDKEKTGRGHVEFIYAALKYMKEFGVERDLEVYKALIEVFPKEKMVPRNLIQAEFMHYPKQQQCAIDLLEQMEENAVIPDWSMEDQLIKVFGRRGYPLRRYWRMMYWLPKFKNASPWLLPDPVPSDTFELARLAIERICSVDVTSKIKVLKTSEVESSLDDTWIVSGQSDDQRSLLSSITEKTPVYVEGGFRIWLRNKAVTYFILRADPLHKKTEDIDIDDVKDLKLPIFSTSVSLLVKKPTVHEQSDGVILAVCATGTSSRDSLLSWVRLLEIENPHLAKLVVLFSQSSPTGIVTPTEEHDNENKQETEKP